MGSVLDTGEWDQEGITVLLGCFPLHETDGPADKFGDREAGMCGCLGEPPLFGELETDGLRVGFHGCKRGYSQLLPANTKEFKFYLTLFPVLLYAPSIQWNRT